MYQATITGNLGRQPEIKYLESGSTVCDFSVAVKQWKKDAPARWVKITCWGKTAEFAANFLNKGDKVVCTGRVERPELYDGRNGQTVLEKFTSETLELAGSKSQSQANPAPSASQKPPTQAAGTPSSVELDDEIPF